MVELGEDLKRSRGNDISGGIGPRDKDPRVLGQRSPSQW